MWKTISLDMTRLGVLLSILFLSPSCIKVGASKPVVVQGPIEIVCSTTARPNSGLEVRFEIKNTLRKDTLWLWQPYSLSIAQAGKDRKLPIRDCPCDAPCAQRAEEWALLPGSSLVLYWNGLVTTCIPENDTLRTIYHAVEHGQYTISLYYRTERYGDIMTHTSDFVLLNP